MPRIDDADLLLPAGAHVLHIGPPKTGTTALQGAFWNARIGILAQGVRYAGGSRHPVKAMLAVSGRNAPRVGAPPPIRHWTDLVAEAFKDPGARVVVSSEGFAYASPAAIERVVRDLGRDRIQVVLTLRPLWRLLASEWQQQVQSGLEMPFETWLGAVFEPLDDPRIAAFWYRQRHDQLIDRWAAVAGPDRVTTVVVDQRDHARLYRVFERLVGLREGTLAPDEDLLNRSLTLEEVSAILALRKDFAAAGLAGGDFDRVVRGAAGPHIKARVPSADEHRIETPQWARERAVAIAREIVAGIEASGVRWHGNLEDLATLPSTPGPGRVPEDVPVPPAVAAALVMAMARAGSILATPEEAARDLAKAPAGALARALARRVMAGVGRRVLRRGR